MEKKTEKNVAVETAQITDGRLAAVRDLIFGENILQYNSEFEDVFNKIKILENETQKNLENAVITLERKVSDLEGLMDHKFQDLNEDLDKKLNELDDEKADRKKLGKALEKIALMLQE
jgi:vacuolar-type H+-ATPase subunit I/STV1